MDLEIVFQSFWDLIEEITLNPQALVIVESKIKNFDKLIYYKEINEKNRFIKELIKNFKDVDFYLIDFIKNLVEAKKILKNQIDKNLIFEALKILDMLNIKDDPTLLFQKYYNILYFYYLLEDKEKIEKFSKKTYQILEKFFSLDSSYAIEFFYLIMLIYEKFQKYDKALEYANIVEKLGIKNSHPIINIGFYQKKESYYHHLNKQDKLLENAIRSLHTNPPNIINAYGKVVYYALMQNDFQTAIKYINKILSLDIDEKIKFQRYLQLAEIYFNLNDKENLQKTLLKINELSKKYNLPIDQAFIKKIKGAR